MALTKIPSELSSTTGIVDNSNATAITIDSNENVGIGTSSPQTSLAVETSGTQNVISPIVTGQTSGVTYGGLYTVRDGSGDQRGLDLKVYTANVGLNTAMRIDSSGNVGIGTTLPTNKLSLYKGIGYGSDSALYSDIGINDTAVDNGGVYQWRTGITGNNGGHSYTLSSIARGGSYTERMRIDASGRVTTPSQPHIHGSPSNASGSGIANAFYTSASRNTLSFSNSRVTVPVAGAYLINFNTISDTGTGRVDARVKVNGSTVASTLTEANGQGYHQKNTSVVLNLSANDYIQVDNDDWYNAPATYYDGWKTLSITLIG